MSEKTILACMATAIAIIGYVLFAAYEVEITDGTITSKWHVEERSISYITPIDIQMGKFTPTTYTEPEVYYIVISKRVSGFTHFRTVSVTKEVYENYHINTYINLGPP